MINKKIAVVYIITFTCIINIYSHCQIPCGIYDDLMRIHQMEENVETIEKSINEINNKPNQNQLVRWVLSKEDHADKISDIVTYYFMTQRIKPDMENYNENLSLLHKILILSMKAKQTTDLSVIETMKETIHSFEHIYIGDDHTH